jgi:hypothetical protein
MVYAAREKGWFSRMKITESDTGGCSSGESIRVEAKGGSLQKMFLNRLPGNNLNYKFRRRY